MKSLVFMSSKKPGIVNLLYKAQDLEEITITAPTSPLNWILNSF